ncbi:uncharacterized protein AB675_7480 [Cyphellophora attinorum]|uniref:BTB domain-containing protein n=1 Tax=Cyphellophora attinorum TaxID=1664694 RepID=A0A0N0NMH3_9EURO|nr:uncharacterized protein AB675_7480 [Phialophora attinorum]KPI40461.1 hypothetical protein AB675_7480 [Phialophora attinorum]
MASTSASTAAAVPDGPVVPAATDLRELIGGSEQDRALKILQHGHYSDLTITCQDHVFKVHKYVLVTKGGTFFETAICAGWNTESQESKIDLPEDDPAIVARVLHYIYTGDCESYDNAVGHQLLFHPLGQQADGETTTSSEPSREASEGPDFKEALLHVYMFAAGVKFGNAGLKELARKAFSDAFHDISCECLDNIAHIETVFAAVYSTTPTYERDLQQSAQRLDAPGLAATSSFQIADFLLTMADPTTPQQPSTTNAHNPISPSQQKRLAVSASSDKPPSTTQYSAWTHAYLQYLSIPPQKATTINEKANKRSTTTD